MLQIVIRDEQVADRAQVRELNEAAFGRRDEADLIDACDTKESSCFPLFAPNLTPKSSATSCSVE